MRIFNKITIVGVGLIGGSIGQAVKKKKLAKEVIGVTRRESRRRRALEFNAVDKATLDLRDGVKDADLVIIAAPIGKIVDLARRAAKFMKNGAILTDVGSSKREIVKKIEKFAVGKVNFVGSHPMAGSDKSGVENADPDIFKEAKVLITKTKNTDKRSTAELQRFWKKLGCHVVSLSPEKHDRLVSLASYLPHIVSFALSASQTKDSVKLAGGSLRDTTRVASSDPKLWSDIFLSTRLLTLKATKIFSKNLNALEKALKKKERKTITEFLKKAKNLRSKIE